MADGKGIRRFIYFALDRKSVSSVEQQMEEALARAGAAGGKGFYSELKGAFNKTIAELKEKLARGIIDEKEFKKQSDAAARAFNGSLLKAMDQAREKGALTEKEYLKLTKTLRKVGDDGQSAGNRLIDTFKGVAATLGIAFGIDRVLGFVRGNIQGAIDSEAVWNRVAGAIARTGENWKDWQSRVRAAGDSLKKFGIDDDLFAQGLDKLLGITGDVGLSVSQMGFAADIAARFFGGDLVQASEFLGRVLNGEARAFREVHITVKDVNEGLRILRDRTKGAAENEMQTLNGSLGRLKTAWLDTRKSMGFFALRLAGGDDSIEVAANRALLGLEGIQQFLDTHRVTWRSFFSGLFAAAATPAAGFNPFEQIPGAATPPPPAKGGLSSDTSIFIPPTDAKAAAEAAKKAAEEADQARQKEIDSLKTAHELRIITVADIDRALKLEREEARIAHDTTRSIDDRAKAAKRLADLKTVTDLPTPSRKIAEPAPQHLQNLETPSKTNPLGLIDQRENETQAQQFLTPWEKALDTIASEVEAQNGLFAQLGEAWAAGGIKGLVAWAGYKVKENVASAIEEGAKAVASFALGDYKGAAAHGKAALGFGYAAVEWGLLKNVAGAAGGFGGSSSAGNLGAPGNTGGTAAQNAQLGNPTGADINIYLPDQFDSSGAKYQDAVGEASRLYFERYGGKITVHRGGR